MVAWGDIWPVAVGVGRMLAVGEPAVWVVGVTPMTAGDEGSDAAHPAA
jgi:hypothetical protein